MHNSVLLRSEGDLESLINRNSPTSQRGCDRGRGDQTFPPFHIKCENEYLTVGRVEILTPNQRPYYETFHPRKVLEKSHK